MQKQQVAKESPAPPKPPKAPDPDYDPLIYDAVFPEPDQILSFVPLPIDQAAKHALVALDTNVLLLPYRSVESLAAIERYIGS